MIMITGAVIFCVGFVLGIYMPRNLSSSGKKVSNPFKSKKAVIVQLSDEIDLGDEKK